MKVEVAIGEVFDKITILDIKLERIKDEERVANIRKERQILSDALEAENLTEDCQSNLRPRIHSVCNRQCKI
jgi:FtsZ-binding cell division protein ZapB